MESKDLSTFKNDISVKLANKSLQENMLNNVANYKKNFTEAIAQFEDLDACKERISYLKKRAFNDLEKYLIEFENKFIRNGGSVFWADSIDDVFKILEEILPEKKSVVLKTKSNTLEEVNVDKYLQSNENKIVETNIGKFITKENNEKASHPIFPTFHLNKEQITELFNSKFNLDKNAPIEEIITFIRKTVHENYSKAQVCITGVNFIVADTGSVAISENEGNVSQATAWSKKHIVIAGIEKVIPSVKDLYLYWSMLASHSTGQKISAYNHLISGPARSSELDGPEEMSVILLNNNRHVLLEDLDLREALKCINCGACSNHCPIFTRISGRTYPSFSGPIGSIISPHINKNDGLYFLSYASPLCGKCTSVCPEKIKIHDLLVYNRHLAVENKAISAVEAKLMRLILKSLKSRKSMDFFKPKIKNIAFKIYLRKSWTKYKAPLIFPEKSFNQIMTEKAKDNTQNMPKNI